MGLLYISVFFGMMARDEAQGQWPTVVLFLMANCGVCVKFCCVDGTPPLFEHSEYLRSCFACM